MEPDPRLRPAEVATGLIDRSIAGQVVLIPWAAGRRPLARPAPTG